MWNNTTTISKKAFYLLNKKMLKYILALLSVGLLGLICSIFLVILKSSYWPLLVGFCAIICGGGYGFIVLKKAEKSAVGKTINYSFFDTYFTVSVSGGNSQITYSSVIKTQEDEQTLLLYISKTQAYIVDKTTLEEGALAFIKEKTTTLTEAENKAI